MKKGLFIIFFALSFVAYSQNIEPLYNGNSIIDTLTVQIENLQTRNEIFIDIVNHSSRPVNVKVRKKELSVLAGTENSFCFGNFCYDTEESSNSFTIDALDTFSQATHGDGAFHIAYYPFNQIGTSVIRYTFFNADFPEDSTFFIAKFITTAGSSINDVFTDNISIYPNPSAIGNIQLFYDFSNVMSFSNDFLFTVTNSLGQTVYACQLDQHTNNFIIETKNWQKGLYFCNFISKNELISIRKIIIQ